MDHTKPNLAAFETNLFGTILGFQKRLMTLLRESGLDDEQMKAVGEQIFKALDNATSEMERTKTWNIESALDGVFQQATRLVEAARGKGS